MISITNFVSKWTGRKIDYDKAYGAQCVDVLKQWEAENKWKITHGNANATRYNADGVNYKWIVNTPIAVPRAGDMIEFALGGYGHVGVVVSATVWSVKVFEQNNPIGSSCHLRSYNYLKPRCVGWLRSLKG